MKIRIEETIYEGTGAEILDQLRLASFDPLEFPDAEKLPLAAPEQFYPHDGSGVPSAGGRTGKAGTGHVRCSGQGRRTGGVGGWLISWYFAYGSNINLEQMDYRCPVDWRWGRWYWRTTSCYFAEVVLPLSLPRREDESMAFCGASRRSASDPGPL